jgi:MFS family permease
MAERRFVRLWTAQTVSEIGSGVTDLALPLTALLLLHATAFQIGLLGAVAVLPYLLFALAAGVLVDRSRPGPLLVGSDIVRALLLGSIPLTYFASRRLQDGELGELEKVMSRDVV